MNRWSLDVRKKAVEKMRAHARSDGHVQATQAAVTSGSIMQQLGTEE